MIQFDCHAHVYETLSAVDGARYMPNAPAPLAGWLEHHKQHALRGGVIVQVSFLGTDNSEMCAALAGLDRSRFAGVGVVALDVSEHTLDDLAKAGMRGVRWNLVRGAKMPDLTARATQSFFDKLRARDLHLELHLEGPRLAPYLAALTDQGVNIVVDHFGLPSAPSPADDPLMCAIRALQDRSALYFKFAAHYRVPFDVRPHAADLLALLATDHVVWGSDWPHTQHESQATYADVRALCRCWNDLSDKLAARRLYGIG